MLFLGHQAVVRSQFLIVLSAVGTLFPIFLRCLSSLVIEFMLPQSSLEDLQSVVPHTALSGPPTRSPGGEGVASIPGPLCFWRSAFNLSMSSLCTFPEASRQATTCLNSWCSHDLDPCPRTFASCFSCFFLLCSYFSDHLSELNTLKPWS